MAEALVHQLQQTRHLLWLGGQRLKLGDLALVAVGVGEVDRRPGGELMIERVRHRQVLLDQPRAETQQRHHRREGERGVEVRATQPHAGRREHVVAAVRPVAASRPDADDREIARAAADVGDQHQLLARHGLFIVMGGRNGFVGKGDIAEASLARHALQHFLRARIRPVVVVDEAHRAPHHDRGDLLAGERLGLLLEVLQKDLDHLGERHLAAAETGLLVDQGRTQDGLQRPHQATLGVIDIGRDGGLAQQHPALGLLVEEDRAREQRIVALDGRQHRDAVAHNADRRIRRAEIKSAGGHHSPLGSRRGCHLLRCAVRCQIVSFRLAHARWRVRRRSRRGRPSASCASRPWRRPRTWRRP